MHQVLIGLFSHFKRKIKPCASNQSGQFFRTGAHHRLKARKLHLFVFFRLHQSCVFPPFRPFGENVALTSSGVFWPWLAPSSYRGSLLLFKIKQSEGQVTHFSLLPPFHWLSGSAAARAAAAAVFFKKIFKTSISSRVKPFHTTMLVFTLHLNLREHTCIRT